MQSVKSPVEAEVVVRRADEDRVIYWFDIPQSIQMALGIEKVGMIELTSGEELMATKRCQQDPIRLAFELAKESVRFVNDDAVNTGDGSADAFWSRRGQGMSKLRQLVLGAYGSIHNPIQDEVQAFLKSRRMQVK
jgi:hypothetical protein